MLGKLMKHEFRATGRIGLPLCGVMLALSLVAGMALRFWGGSDEYGWWERVGSIVVILYGMSIFAVAIGIFVILMQHFKRNLLGDEGYLMRVLPVSMHELLLSKLFVALVWYIVSAVLIAISALLVVFLSGEVPLDGFADFWRGLRAGLGSLNANFWVRSVLGWLGAMTLLTLLFYADFTLSQTFSKHKVLYNIMGVVIFLLLLRLIFGLNDLLDAHVFRAMNTAGSSVGIIGGADGPTAIYVTGGDSIGLVGLIELYISDALLYFLTWGFLKYRPNLE